MWPGADFHLAISRLSGLGRPTMASYSCKFINSFGAQLVITKLTVRLHGYSNKEHSISSSAAAQWRIVSECMTLGSSVLGGLMLGRHFAKLQRGVTSRPRRSQSCAVCLGN